jgi:hypothetical protein
VVWTSKSRASTTDPLPPWVGLTRRPDSDADRPLAGQGRVRLPGPAWASRDPAAAARGEFHPDPAVAA